MGSNVLFRVEDIVEGRMGSKVLFRVVGLVDGMVGKVGSWGAGFVRLHFAPSDWTSEWTTLELLPGVGKWMASSSTDVDGDGLTDIVVGAKESPVSVAVLKQGSDARDPTKWTYVPISSSIEERWVMSLASHDIDGDGRVDAVVSFRGTQHGPGVFWLQNTGSLDGTDWPHHRMLADVTARVMMLDLVDLYGTGSVDVVVAEERPEAAGQSVGGALLEGHRPPLGCSKMWS